jgi:hypothetical protein
MNHPRTSMRMRLFFAAVFLIALKVSAVFPWGFAA